ncbi:phosphatidate cytidylyltransferase [Fictibacillus aquaticus]|uniref:Phosphatidate cytidylyltransferase n=1 Tax=Fictibacillus aquaticus TaxID=2021314 RepID=A0A235FCZ5_9BACL|nr:phosphatidate cytidylyltransferase [Fictibacillus aquaticus]OYD58827.1 phosphatidate cytidylyltransferase [Fictibacillus aquaticus]
MKERIITGIIAAILFGGLVIYGSWPFSALVILLTLIGMYELLKMKGFHRPSGLSIIGYILSAGLALPKEWMDMLVPFTKQDMLVAAVLLLLVVTVVSKNKTTFDDIAFVFLGSAYIGFGFYYLIETRFLEDGLSIVFFILFMIWAADSGAYFTGKAIGKRKLWPVISPNKTIEGALGGIVWSAAVGAVCSLTGFVSFPLLTAIAISLFVGVFGQLGDLAQSAFKRVYGVKDSGNLLPGHGGILDRLDSVLFVMPLLHVLHFL